MPRCQTHSLRTPQTTGGENAPKDQDSVLNLPRPLSNLQPLPHFEPSLDALSLRSDVISSIKILSSSFEYHC